jgi:hypothetical protein
MAIFTCEPGWRGQSVNGKWQNHESSFDETEMVELAKQIVSIPGMSGDEPQGMHAKFKLMRTALASSTESIKITKGIHQRLDKVHFDVKIGNGSAGIFHIFVAPGVAIIVEGTPSSSGSKIKRKLAPYVPTGMSVPDGNILRLWPSQFTLSDLEKPVGRPRNYSLSTGNSIAPPRFDEIVKKGSDFHIVYK